MPPISLLPGGYLLAMAAWLLAGAAAFAALLRWRAARRRAARPLTVVHLLLSGWMLLAAVTLPELWCALFADETDSFNLTNISRRWSALHVALNQAGFRDRRPLEKGVAGDARRIWFAGDSFTFGQGVADPADRFSDRIAKEWNQRSPESCEVHNIALPGQDIVGVRRIVEKLFKDGCRADVVVYVCCLNDIDQLDPASRFYFAAISASQPQFFLWRDTYFFNRLYFRTQQFARPEIRNYFDVLAGWYEGEAWWRMQQEIELLREVCKNNGAELRIAIFPFLHNLGPDYPFRNAHRQIVEFCEMEKIGCLDLDPVFQRHAGEPLTVNRYDAHPNERAHAIAAHALREGLLQDIVERRSP